MPESYDVTTPLGQQWVDTTAEVRQIIDAYMQQPGATLSKVTVVKLPDQRIGNGEAQAPSAFWP
jgi:hypothetical protein